MPIFPTQTGAADILSTKKSHSDSTRPDLTQILGDGIDGAELTRTLRDRVNQFSRSFSNIHRPDGSPNVFLFSLPRSGSTWLMELVRSQPGFKFCNEPLNLRNPLVRQHLGITSWQGLYTENATASLQKYFAGFNSGRLRFMNPSPFGKYHRTFTNRIVFKMIHGCEDRINWCRDAFNANIVYLVRHPIAVALSREVYPTLPALLSSNYRQHFTDDQLSFAQTVLESGSKLEIGVLSWCLQTAVPLRHAADDWAIVSYEQLVQDPDTVIRYLCDKLVLPAPDRMVSQIDNPSYVKFKSDKETQRMLEADSASKRSWLIEKWRERIGKAEEQRAMKILEQFEIDVYKYGEMLPARRLWIRM